MQALRHDFHDSGACGTLVSHDLDAYSDVHAHVAAMLEHVRYVLEMCYNICCMV